MIENGLKHIDLIVDTRRKRMKLSDHSYVEVILHVATRIDYSNRQELHACLKRARKIKESDKHKYYNKILFGIVQAVNMSSTQEKYVGDTADVELFNPNVLERLSLSHIEGLSIRPLKSGDYDRGFLQLLTQLTEVGNVSKEQFLNRFHMMKAAGSYYITVIEDASTGKIVASATLVIEQKFIHNCALRGHLEDVVVNNKYRGKHLGKLIVKIISQLARHLRCYKLSLECKDNLIPFYESLGFKCEPNNANYLNMRFQMENNSEQSHL